MIKNLITNLFLETKNNIAKTVDLLKECKRKPILFQQRKKLDDF